MIRTDAEDLALVLANASHYTAVAFRGRGHYDRVECPSLDAARQAAKGLYTNRPVGIYVVARNLEGATSRERHLENWEPARG